MLALLCVAGVANAAEYEIDKKFTSVADLNGKLFMIVNETDGKAIYNKDAQNLDYQDYATAVTGAAYLWKINAINNQDYYTVQIVKADGTSPSFWGNNDPKYLNSGAPGGFNGCFVLGNGSQQGTDVANGGVWYIEYSNGNGFTLKNVARNGYFAGVNPAPTGTDPIYWTFCTIKEKIVEDTEDPGVKKCPEDWTDMIVNGTLEGEDNGNFYQEVGEGKTPATITSGSGRIGGRGISITSKEGAKEVWDTQFFLAVNEAMAAGTKLHIEFDYKANKAAKVTTQAHSAPGSFLSNNGIGDVNFGLSWEHFKTDIIVKDEGMKSIAFNLNENKAEAITFFFDNLVMWSKANAITKGTYDATDAKVIDFADFTALDGSWNAETKTFTGNCGFKWEDGLDLSQYRYLIVTLGKNASTGGYEATIKDKNGKTVVGDQYGADFMNMWFGQWNNHNCMKIDLEKLRSEKEFDIHNIVELSIKGGEGLVLGTVYASNTKPNNDKDWGNEDNGDFKFAGLDADKFGTVCLNFDAAVAGAKIFEIASATEKSVSLIEYEGILKAGKPYIYQANDNASKNVYFYKATNATVETPIVNNGLIGTFTETKAPQGTNYMVLSNNKLWTVNSDVTVAANKAYIDVNQVASSNARGTVFLPYGEVTAIEGVKLSLNGDEIYNLNGQRLAQPTKGVNVIGGKKVIIK